MPYQLEQTQNFKTNLDNLPKPIIEKKVPRFINNLCTNPNYPGLNTKPQYSLRGEKVNRSRVDRNYRCLWRYNGQNTIQLLHILGHQEADAIDHIGRNKPANYSIMSSNEKKSTKISKKSQTDVIRKTRNRIFENVDPTLLQLFGFSDAQIQEIKSITTFQQVETLPMDERKFEFLLEICTRDFEPGILVTAEEVIYRANADKLEYYCQGKIKSLLLKLSGEQEKAAYAENSGVTLIKGVAGSGKTTIGVYRALHLAQRERLFETKPTLFLTYTKTLARVIAKLFEELLPEQELENFRNRVRVFTFRDWAVDYLSENSAFQFDPGKAQKLLEEAMRNVVNEYELRANLMQNSFLTSEVSQVIKGRNVETLETYLNIKRYGTGKALQKERRKLIWKIYEEYIHLQEDKKIWDESDLYIHALKKSPKQKISSPIQKLLSMKPKTFHL